MCVCGGCYVVTLALVSHITDDITDDITVHASIYCIYTRCAGNLLDFVLHVVQSTCNII